MNFQNWLSIDRIKDTSGTRTSPCFEVGLKIEEKVQVSLILEHLADLIIV